MTNRTKGNIIKASAVAVDVGVPLIATFTQFPIWVEKSSEATVSGLLLLFAFLSCLPFLKQIKEYMKSPSVVVVWVVLLVLLSCLRNIIDQMIVVCFFGAIANALGAGLYKIGNVICAKEDTRVDAPNNSHEEEGR
jgi:hypothetical protein